MSKYSEMSDDEINKAVAKKLGVKFDDINGFLFINYESEVVFNPCNSWADAGPIIERSGITVACRGKYKSEAWDSIKGLIDDAVVEHDNPLRAAMIVFLMMNEVTNEC